MKAQFEYPLKIMVTGTRGKSSLVRLIHSAFLANGINAWGRITGVLPRELTPHGETLILRSSGGHVQEMKWWLSSVPPGVESIVMENSAVSPDLQFLACDWLLPHVTVLTNIYPDHQEAWGPYERDAAFALSRGIGRGCSVILGPGLEEKNCIMDILRSKRCLIHTSPCPQGENSDFRDNNLSTALELCRFLGFDTRRSEDAMRKIAPDMADFRVLSIGGTELAFGFSANDMESTRELFDMTGWSFENSMILYNHRKDRSERLKSFKDWILQNNWSSVCITGDRPPFSWTWKYFRGSRDLAALIGLYGQGKKVFGCGNVAGLPLKLVLKGGR